MGGFICLVSETYARTQEPAAILNEVRNELIHCSLRIGANLLPPEREPILTFVQRREHRLVVSVSEISVF